MILNKQRLEKQLLPANRPVLGLDFGSKVLGYAVSDQLLWGASPLLSWPRQKLFSQDVAKCQQLITAYKASALVVGWPLRSDGSASEICKAVQRFCERLEVAITIPIILWDERFSSLSAEKILKQQGLNSKRIKRQIDKQAASHLLQGFLDYWQQLKI